MKCIKCKKTFKDTLNKCPFCKTEVSKIDVSSNEEFKEHIDLLEQMEDKLSETIELKPTKKKKRDNRELSLDETIAINVNVLNENNYSLLDEINKQIDSINEEAIQERKKNYVDIKEYIKEENKLKEEMASLESFRKRRNVLVITGIASVLLICIMMILFVISSRMNNDNVNSNIDYNQMLKKSLNTYYETGEIDDLIYLMEDIKDNSLEVQELQYTVKNTCYGWVIRYREEDVSSIKEFEQITYEYKELLDGIYRYALVKNDDQYIRALTEIDYDEIMSQFDTIYTDSLVFYEALELFNQKDYNKAYYMFNKVEKDNTYYEDSITYIDKIYENIIELLNKDIVKIETGIDLLDDKEKLNVYILIEETILEYNNVYNVNLSDYSEYQNILSNYTSKVSHYTDIVYNVS